MSDPLHQSWNDLHENSPFPFEDRASLRSTDRTATIPVQAIRDLVLATPQLNTPTRLGEIERTLDAVILRFFQGNIAIATATVEQTGTEWVEIADDVGTPAGRLRIDPTTFSTLFGLAVKTYRFNAAGATLVPWVTFYRPRNGFRGFRLPDGTVLTGEITLIAADGLRFTADGHLDAVGDPLRDVPEEGLIPRAVSQLILDDQVTQQILTPQKGAITGRAVNPGGNAPAVRISNPSGSTIKVEVTG